MSSPFPGMDPYLAHPGFWSDFHSTFIHCWREAIADALPDNYAAKIDEQVYLVEQGPEARKLGRPDIGISDSPFASAAERAGAAVGAATLEPVTIPLTLLEGPTETYIEILHLSDRSLVAALELLSPTNKESNRQEHLTKRRAFINQNVHLIELDLLLGGRRMPMDRPLPPGDYYYTIARAEQRPDCQVYGWGLRDRLPTLPVPLRSPDPDIHIDLAKVFATAYQRGRYRRWLRYDEPALSLTRAEDRQWAAGVATTR